VSEESRIDFSIMTTNELYRVRNWASKTKNQTLLLQIKFHLNGRTGSGDIPSYPVTTLNEVLENEPAVIWIVVDHAITDTSEAERRSHRLKEVVYARYGEKIKVNMHSGEIDSDRLHRHPVVLLALSNCFVVLKADGTNKMGMVIPYYSLD